MGVALVFDITGDMALFRKPYTTTSMVSYPFPPPTAVAGLIAAIIGINHGADQNAKSARYWDAMSGVQVGIALQNPLRWMNTAVNLMKLTKSLNEKMTEHIQVKHQLAKKPRYRIYVQGGDVYLRLKQRLEREEFIYTPCLGAAYALADIEYQGEYTSAAAEPEVGFDTIVPAYNGLELDIVRSGAVFSEQVPMRMTSARRLSQTVQVYYALPSKDGKPAVYVRNQGTLQSSMVNGEKVAWFHAW